MRYFDYSATTPVHPTVVEVMRPFWRETFGNPSSVHRWGRSAETHLSTARNQIATLLGASASELIFTGGGTESDNIALRGVMFQARKEGNQNAHLITCCTEHKAVLETAIQLRDLFGFELTILPVDSLGRLNLTQLEEAIQPNTALISLMTVNNEIGVIHPIHQIGEIARKHNVLFHTDAVQAIGTRAWDLHQMPIDLLTMTAHKIGGPKGCGLLYLRKGITLTSPMTGGGQEKGYRAGTQNVGLAVGTAEAVRITLETAEQKNQTLLPLRDRILTELIEAIPNDCIITGDVENRASHIASVAFRNIRANDLLMHLDLAGIATSSGSACTVGNPEPSHVLRGLGVSNEWTEGGLRISLGEGNTAEDVDILIPTIITAVQRLQKMNRYR